MTLSEVKEHCAKGKLGRIPKWLGYLKWDYAKHQIYFSHNDYRMEEDELERLLKNRNDLYYIT